MDIWFVSIWGYENVNKAVMNMLVCVCYEYKHSFLEYTAGSRMWGHRVDVCLTLPETAKHIFKTAMPFCMPQQRVRISVAPGAC